MHALETIVAVNARAVEVCQESQFFGCSRSRQEVEASGQHLHNVEVFDPGDLIDEKIVLCTDCLADASETANDHGLIVKEV